MDRPYSDTNVRPDPGPYYYNVSCTLSLVFPGIKSENADLVLFVRVGGFYELFGADADLGALVGLKLMGGAELSSGAMVTSSMTPTASDRSTIHRAGCRAQSFLFWASKIVALGYSVGRVEEVGTALPVHHGGDGQKHKGGVPAQEMIDTKIFNNSKPSKASKSRTKERALVQVYSPATFGLWFEGFDDGAEHTSSSTTAVFLALCEDARTSGLLGACCVDVAGGVLSVGAWQEVDVERSMLAGVVEVSGVREVVVDDLGRLSVDTRRAVAGLRVSADAGVEMRCGLRYVRGYGVKSGSSSDSMVTKTGAVSGDAIGGPAGGLIDQEAASLVAKAEASGLELFGGSLSSRAYREVGLKAITVALQYMRDTNVMHGMASRMCVRGLDVGEDVSAAPALLDPSSSSFSSPTCMVLNGTSLRNMEIFQGASLHRFLSGFARTMMGTRAIRRWLAKPLMRVEDIEHRLDVVDAFQSSGLVDCRVLEEGLLKLHDVEKRMPMVAHQLSTHQLGDANESLMSLTAVPTRSLAADQERMVTWGQVKLFSSVIRELLYFAKEYISWFSRAVPSATAENPLLHRIHEDAVAAHDVCLPILGSIPVPGIGADASVRTAPADTEPVLLPQGVWPSIDRCRAVVESREAELTAHGQALVELVLEACRVGGGKGTGTRAATLQKIRISGIDEAIGVTCNRSLEAAMAHAFPQWKPSERSRSGIVYREARLTALAVDLAKAQRAYNLEANQVMSVLFNLFLDEYETLLRFCQGIGQVDALLAFAKLAEDGHGLDGHVVLSRPRFEMPTAATKPRLFLRDAWNPQLLTHIPPTRIVANTISMGGGSPTVVIVSGANSGGKTSILKTAAIATIMAQVGCYVPCSYSRITPVSKILTRLGARDRLSAGESTFAIEMKETSAILGQADANALAIIDELGRGTSPRDGMAIAWATLNTLASHCRTMLATHYHELNEDFEFDPRVARFHMPIDRDDGRFRLRAGPEPQFESGGILCARDAGVCEGVLRRATHISGHIKRMMRDARASRERRLAMALLETMVCPSSGRPMPARPSLNSKHALPSLDSLQRLQLQVTFLLDDD